MQEGDYTDYGTCGVDDVVDPEAQVNEESIPSIAGLDLPLVMGSRPKN